MGVLMMLLLLSSPVCPYTRHSMIVAKAVAVLRQVINAHLLMFQAREGNVAIRTSIGGLHYPRTFAAGLRTQSTSLSWSYTHLPR